MTPRRMTIDLDELCRVAAQEMLAVALLAERRAYLDAHAAELDATGQRLVVGNGYARATGGDHRGRHGRGPGPPGRRPPRRASASPRPSCRPTCASRPRSPRCCRSCTCGACPPGTSPRHSPSSSAPKPGCRPQRSTGSPRPGRPSTRTGPRGTSRVVDYVYLWVDGVHFNIRLEEDRLCCLVIVGVRPDGTKELVALADGYRESTDSWADVLRSLRERGLAAPVLAVGDGALGFWGALREVFPTTREQRCWVHRTANVLDALPKRLHDDAKEALTKIYAADSRTGALEAVKVFTDAFAEFPKATAKITERPRRAARFLRLPGRTLDPPAHHEPDRVDLLDGAAQDQGHPGSGIT